MNRKIGYWLYYVLPIILVFLGCTGMNAQKLSVERMGNGQPLISKNTFLEAGYPETDADNINGPCLVKLPDWLPHSERISANANYYLYFAHHHGKYIRLAWAEHLEGPYQLVTQSTIVPNPQETVLSLSTVKMQNDEMRINGHVASPCVIVDHKNKIFKLFFHAYGLPTKTNKRMGQKTFLATSSNGLYFGKNVSPVSLGDSYFTPFNIRNRWYAFSNGGFLYRAPSAGETVIPFNYDYTKDLWERKSRFFKEALEVYSKERKLDPAIGVRHLSQWINGNTMYVFFSSRTDTPERIYWASVDISDEDFRKWHIRHVELLMQAEKDWEGGHLKPRIAVGGYAKEPINEVRDPFIFNDNGQLYMFYCAGGERGIGMVRIYWK